jgi:hypothetical protein
MRGKHASLSSERGLRGRELDVASALRSTSGVRARLAPFVVALRIVMGFGGWALAVAATQVAAGDDIGMPWREREEQLEQELKARSAPTLAPEPSERTHEDLLDPWELVGV